MPSKQGRHNKKEIHDKEFILQPGKCVWKVVEKTANMDVPGKVAQNSVLVNYNCLSPNIPIVRLVTHRCGTVVLAILPYTELF